MHPKDAEEPSADRPWTIRSSSVDGVIDGRYRITRKLGEGGMGEVYEADDDVLAGKVALKVLRPLQHSTTTLERFRREMALARRVTHENVCRLHDVGEYEGHVYLTMELLDGKTLEHHGPMTEDALERIAAQLVAGLGALHAAGIVHRDLKPSNVMLAGERVVITDFGLARSLEAPTAYMAPEQIEGGTITPATDVYALGVVLFELATGKLPGDITLAIARADLAQRWDTIIARCLARVPAKRPQLEQVRRTTTWFRQLMRALGVASPDD